MLIFLYGADVFRSQEKLSELKNQYFSENSSGSGLSVLDFGEKIPLEKIKENFFTSNLFSSQKLIVFLNTIKYSSPENQKEILDLLKKNKTTVEDKDNVFIFWEEEPKKNGSLYKFLAKAENKQEFTPLEGPALNKWALEKLKNIASNIKINNDALSQLILSTGNDLYLMSNELLKLSNHAKNETITAQDVNLLIKSKYSSTIFETIESLLSGNKKRALDLLHQQIQKGEDIFYIFSMYIYQIRNLLKICEYVEQGETNQYSIAKLTKLHPYVVQKSLVQLKKTSSADLKKIFKQLEIIDITVKTTKTDMVQLLDLLIATI